MARTAEAEAVTDDADIPEVVRGREALAPWLGINSRQVPVFLSRHRDVVPKGRPGVNTVFPRVLILELRRRAQREREAKFMSGITPLKKLLGLSYRATNALVANAFGHRPWQLTRLTREEVAKLQQLVATTRNSGPTAVPPEERRQQKARRTERKCLCCGKAFMSAGSHNRMCWHCKQAA